MGIKRIIIHRILFCLLFLVSFLILQACPNGNVPDPDSITIDSDGDGISDNDELNIYSFNASANPYKFNPFIADVPDIKIELTSPPQIQIKYEYEDGSSETISTERSTESSQTSTNSWETSEGVEISASCEISAEPSLTLSGSVSAGFSWSDEQSTENSEAYSSAEEKESSYSVSASEAKVSITVKITNTGNKSFTLQNLVLSGTNVDRVGSEILNSFGNLEYQGNSDFPATTIAPGDSISGLNFSTADLYVDVAKEMLRQSSDIYVGVALSEIIDPLTSLPVNAQMTEINAKTATVFIDYDSYKNRDDEELYVAITSSEDSTSMSLKSIFEDILYLPFEEGSVGSYSGLKSINGYDFSEAEHNRWIIVHSYEQAGVVKSYTYDITRNSCSLDNININAGDSISLLHLMDSDGDGLSHRLENAMGTSDDTEDTFTSDDYSSDYDWFVAGHPDPNPVAVTYELSFNGNGSNGGTVPATLSAEEGGNVPISDNSGNLIKNQVNGISYRFAGWNSQADGNGTNYDSSNPYTMGSSDTILYAKWVAFQVKDIGPGGGYIFYIKNAYSDGWRYMEAAPVDQVGQNTTRIKFTSLSEINATTYSEIGFGKTNTDNLYSEDSYFDIPVSHCLSYTVGGYNDWFLPSIDELEAMFDTIGDIGGFVTEYDDVEDYYIGGGYWSSSLGGSGEAYCFFPASVTVGVSEPFSDHYDFERELHVRAVRWF